ncbi:MAG: hypothetical protein II557_08605 [Clostridia bacterium]|nr:hypothetical protein [Clostridia bacterium]
MTAKKITGLRTAWLSAGRRMRKRSERGKIPASVLSLRPNGAFPLDADAGQGTADLV